MNTLELAWTGDISPHEAMRRKAGEGQNGWVAVVAAEDMSQMNGNVHTLTWRKKGGNAESLEGGGCGTGGAPGDFSIQDESL